MELELTDANFDETVKSANVALIDLWAEWCGPCRKMAPTVAQIAQNYDGKVVVGKLNITENEETPAKLGVMSIPTFLIYKNGTLVDKVVGAVPAQVLQEKLDAQLA